MKRINKWLIDKYLVDTAYQDKLLVQLENAGFEVYQGEYIPFLKESFHLPESFKNEPIGIYGSFEFVREYTKRYDNILSFGANDNFKCSMYLSHGGSDHFLNNSPFFTTFALFEKNIKGWLDMFESNVFIRPDSGFKTFTGLPITEDNYETELNSLKQLANPSPETLILVASGVSIKSEYRFIICDGEVVTYSSYKVGNDIVTDKKVPDSVIEYAKKVISNTQWFPDFCFVMDVATLSSGCHKVIEYNAFSHSDFYESDYAKAFDAAGRFLYKENVEVD
jgi:hypothetical protein